MVSIPEVFGFSFLLSSGKKTYVNPSEASGFLQEFAKSHNRQNTIPVTEKYWSRFCENYSRVLKEVQHAAHSCTGLELALEFGCATFRKRTRNFGKISLHQFLPVHQKKKELAYRELQFRRIQTQYFTLHFGLLNVTQYISVHSMRQCKSGTFRNLIHELLSDKSVAYAS